MVRKNKKNLVKQDMNFLEFPLWLTDKKDHRSTLVINVENGTYTLDATPRLGIPASFDALVLYYLLFISQKDARRGNNFFDVSAYEICKNLNITKTASMYKRIMKALDIWRGVSIKFDGSFYVGRKQYASMGFGILSYKTEEKKDKNDNVHKRRIKIRFDDTLLQVIEQSRFFQNIDLDLMIGLKRPLARRLYEYLPKQFLKKNTFSIGVDKLFPKIGLIRKKYNSEIIRQIKSIQSAINQINTFDENYTYSIEYYKNNQDKFICTFRRENKEIEEKQPPALEENISVDAITAKLKAFKVHGNSIRSIIRQHSVSVLNDVITDFGFLLEKKAKSNHPIENPGAYFRSPLPKPGDAHEFSTDYQKHLKAEELRAFEKKRDEEEKRKAREANEKKNREFRLGKKLDQVFSDLPEREKQTIRAQAEGAVDVNKYGREMHIKFEIRDIVKGLYNIDIE
ncbi:replication initiator protein A [Magnetococcales bacterium HHB-1]